MKLRASGGARPTRCLRAWRPAALALVLFLATGAVRAQPSFAEFKAAHRPSDVTVLDRHGLPVQTLRVDPTVRRLAWVPLQEMSPALLHAIVLSEDRNFYQHSGVDWAAVGRAAWGNLWNTRTRGASTLTMQLAGLLDQDLSRPSGGRSVGQKLGQVVVARRLESGWKKTEILEAYLNAVAWRGELVGINALSQTLFGKLPGGLDAQEAAIAAALVRGPNAPVATVAQRACGVLQQQQRPCTGVTGLTESALLRRGGPALGEQLAPHFARQLLAAQPSGTRKTLGPSLASTLDASLQRLARQTLHQQLSELRGRSVEDGAVLVLDNRTGEVRAWVGSSGELSDAAAVDGVLARRQPGSTLKPFVYGLAFERRLITPASLLDDSPAQLGTRAGLYLPRNYSGSYQGWVSARSALGGSLNVPAVRVGAMLPPEALFQRLNALGMALPESGGYYGHALTLGAAEVTLLALTNAYRTLANGGLHSPPRLQPAGQRPGTPQRVLPAAATHLVTDILADNNARVRTFGLDNPLATRGFAAVKTGTSKDLRDNWCVGFTAHYTVGVWVGNASGAPMHDVSGTSGAAPVWQTLVQQLQALHRDDPRTWQPPPPPAGVVQLATRFAPASEPPRSEWYLAGTEQPVWTAGAAASRQQRRFGIVNPRDGSIYALDPDIPPQAQRIRFEGENGTWLLNGKRLGSGPDQSWAPWPGRHELQLRSTQGQVLQTVRFEVRGAVVKPASQAGRR